MFWYHAMVPRCATLTVTPVRPAPSTSNGTACGSSAASPAAVSVTFWSACPCAGTFSVPDAGLTVIPAGGAAVHGTAPPSPSDRTRSVTVAEPPGSSGSVPGSTEARDVRAPWPNDGGSAASPAPSAVFGCAAIV